MTKKQFLRAIQFNTIATLRNRFGSERFVEWLMTPCHLDGMTPVEALESGLCQEVAELAESTKSEAQCNYDARNQ